ncbi:MAG: alpha-amylase family glycosyl hydrolase [Bacteroidia bacterium]|jgi:glycosidase|nr:alpha-amylase family glycosyl hydrolase [Bacteroidia bacterium]
MKKYLFICFLISVMGLNAQQNQSLPVFYQIFVRSFADGNGDGVGDINGIRQKLTYLQQLGIKGIWLTPIHPSPTYHKYDVTDYKAIDPEYGTLEEFKLLVQEAHQKQIKVIMDFVVNHTSSEHPWFKASTQVNSPYTPFYVWNFDTIGRKEWYSNPRNPQQKYYAFFWERMPDLNFDYQPVRDAIKDAGAFWLKEANIDGFRLDAAQHVYDASDVIKNNEWWSEFRTAMRAVKPDVLLIGEVWNKDSIVATYLKSSLDASFNFDLSKAITHHISSGTGKGFTERLYAIHALYKTYKPDFLDAIFITNHDQDRYHSIFGGDEAKSKQAFTLLMTLPGLSFMYYGEEIGMLGKFPDEYRREPFLWNTKDVSNTTWQIPRYSNLNTVKPLAAQLTDSNAIYYHYKRWIAIRNANPVFSKGNLLPTQLITQTPSVIAYELHDGINKVLVIHNVSAKNITISKPSIGNVWIEQGVSVERKIEMQPNSTIIFKLP